MHRRVMLAALGRGEHRGVTGSRDAGGWTFVIIQTRVDGGILH